MYKPPANCNRVKSIKSKFENIENDGPAQPYKTVAPLSRQLSDPAKCNIKRTNAFRLERPGAPFQRDAPSNRSHFDSKVKQYSSALKCDNSVPQLVKSKSSHDFAYIRNKFDRNQRENEPDLSLLYTEPIPKALRPTVLVESPKSIHTVNTLKISDSVSDTLKTVLNRPLPGGPAPQKPPRTFEHTPVKPQAEKNLSFLHLKKEEAPQKPAKKDPRYMLNKLENALRNNKIRARNRLNSSKDVSTTSGEDSDDSVLFRSKEKKLLDGVSLNCLNGICQSGYERLPEANSSFFVSFNEEPVYAEPFGAPLNKPQNQNHRNSLYYMSTELLCDGGKRGQNRTMTNEAIVKKDEHFVVNHNKDLGNMTSQHQLSGENSSLSSFTSDLDSAASTPLEESNPMESTLRIKHLIDAFETNQPVTGDKWQKSLCKSLQQNPRRIEDLKASLQETLNKSFANESDSSDESKTSSESMVDKFQIYIKTMPKYRKPKKNIDDGLFYCCLIVGWELNRPKIITKFPIDVMVPPRIEDLCYPEATSGPLDKSDNAQCYSLVVTNDRGERTFGYCRRVIPEGSSTSIPLVYCILSKHRAPRFYKKILIELESRHGIPERARDELLSSLYRKKFPKLGESITIDLKNNQGVMCVSNGYGSLNKKASVSDQASSLVLTLHPDAQYEEADLKPLHKLPPDILLKIFASLLQERKVILISCLISKLSSCVDALQTILYPFSWPHTFIPILPQCLWDVVESPTPVICGILSVDVTNKHDIEHGIVVDLDEGNIIGKEGDEDQFLSNSMKDSWMEGLALAKLVPEDNFVHSVFLSDAYIRVFIVSLKHYKNHIVNGVFERENFIKKAKTRGIRRFLKWFTQSTMFSAFIDSVIKNPDSFSLFDNKIKMYGSGTSSDFLSKLFEWRS